MPVGHAHTHTQMTVRASSAPPDHRPRQAPLAPITLITSQAFFHFDSALLSSGEDRHRKEGFLKKYELRQCTGGPRSLNLKRLTPLSTIASLDMTEQARGPDPPQEAEQMFSLSFLRGKF